MELDKILEGPVTEAQRRCLEKTAVLIAAGKSSALKAGVRKEIMDTGRQDSARRKILAEALETGWDDPMAMEVGKHLFSQGDVQLLGRILLRGKHLEECIRYIMKCAEKKAHEAHKNALYVPPDIVFGWAEDYYRADVVNRQDLYPAVPGEDAVPEGTMAAGRQNTGKAHIASGRKTGQKRTGRNGAGKNAAPAAVWETPAGKQAGEKDGQMSLFDMP